MLTMCPTCFGLNNTKKAKRCKSCKATYVNVHEELELVVIKLLLLGFKVAYADCAYIMTDDELQIKTTLINVVFWYDYPDSLFEGLPTAWVYKHIVTDTGNSEINFMEEYPAEYDYFHQWCKRHNAIEELEAWIDNCLDADSLKAVLRLGGYL